MIKHVFHEHFIERQYLIVFSSGSYMIELKEFWLKRLIEPVCWVYLGGTKTIKEGTLESLSDEEILELMRITSGNTET